MYYSNILQILNFITGQEMVSIDLDKEVGCTNNLRFLNVNKSYLSLTNNINNNGTDINVADPSNELIFSVKAEVGRVNITTGKIILSSTMNNDPKRYFTSALAPIINNVEIFGDTRVVVTGSFACFELWDCEKMTVIQKVAVPHSDWVDYIAADNQCIAVANDSPLIYVRVLFFFQIK